MDRLKKLAAKGKINEQASVRDAHSIIINSPVEQVWEILCDLNGWPTWNPQIRKIQAPEQIKVGDRFTWEFNGTKFRSEIQSVEPQKRISWTSKSRWVKTIHVWELESDDNQTIASISTSLQGALTVWVKSHQTIYNELLVWLDSLQKKLENKITTSQ